MHIEIPVNVVLQDQSGLNTLIDDLLPQPYVSQPASYLRRSQFRTISFRDLVIDSIAKDLKSDQFSLTMWMTGFLV